MDVLFYSGTIVLWVVKFEDNTCERPSGAMDSALDFGSSGCRFESCLGRYVPVAQLDKASDYESGDCRFESCRDQQIFCSTPGPLAGSTVTYWPNRVNFCPSKCTQITSYGFLMDGNDIT